MDESYSLISIFLSWLPLLLFLGVQVWVSVWATLKLVKVQQAMVAAQNGILQKLADIEQRFSQTSGPWN